MAELFDNVRWIFFDVGYTLLDETAPWQERFERMSPMLRERGRDITPEQIWPIFDSVFREYEPLLWIGLCRRLGIKQEEAVELGNGYRHDLEVPHDGAVDVLQRLHGRYKLGIIANQVLGTAQRLEHHGMRPYIDVLIGSAEAGVRKPDPKIFQMALEKANCTPAEAVMVGDRIDNDVRPANALGWRTIHVRQGGGALHVPRSPIEQATATVDGIGEVAKLFGV